MDSLVVVNLTTPTLGPLGDLYSYQRSDGNWRGLLNFEESAILRCRFGTRAHTNFVRPLGCANNTSIGK